jgi:hypothetical protein
VIAGQIETVGAFIGKKGVDHCCCYLKQRKARTKNHFWDVGVWLLIFGQSLEIDVVIWWFTM